MSSKNNNVINNFTENGKENVRNRNSNQLSKHSRYETNRKALNEVQNVQTTEYRKISKREDNIQINKNGISRKFLKSTNTQNGDKLVEKHLNPVKTPNNENIVRNNFSKSNSPNKLKCATLCTAGTSEKQLKEVRSTDYNFYKKKTEILDGKNNYRRTVVTKQHREVKTVHCQTRRPTVRTLFNNN